MVKCDFSFHFYFQVYPWLPFKFRIQEISLSCNLEWMQLWIKLQWFVSTKYFCQALKNWLWKIILKPWSPFQLQISQIKVFSSSLKVRKIQENLISHASEVSIFTNNKENGKISILHRTNVIITCSLL